LRAAPELRYNANKGVLLACGGFPGNPYMMEQLDPLGTSVTTACSYSPADKGYGIRAAVWAGANFDKEAAPMLFDRGIVAPGVDGGYVASDSAFGGKAFPGPIRQYNPGTQPFLKVNRNGERFANESSPYNDIVYAAAHQPGRVYAQICDANILEGCRLRPPHRPCPGNTSRRRHGSEQSSRWCGSALRPPEYWRRRSVRRRGPAGGQQHRRCRCRGCISRARSMRRSQPAPCSSATPSRSWPTSWASPVRQKTPSSLPLTATTSCTTRKNDEDFGKPAYRLSAIRTAPFYGCWLGASLLCTEQGIAINDKGQALDNDNKPMPGLYVTGDMSGSFFANNYPCLMAGVAMGRTLTFAIKAIKQMGGLE